MATRLYTSLTAAPVTPAAGTYSGSGGWDIPAAGSPPTANKLLRAGNWPGAVAHTTVASAAEAVTTANQDVCTRRFVSDPIVGAQTIAGTLKGQMYMSESNAGANMLPRCVVKVVSGDGATLRGTLYAGDTRTTNVDEIDASILNRRVPATGVSPVTLTSVVAQSGDRVLIEVGVRANNTVATSYTSSIRLGSTATPGGANDVTEGGSEAGNTNLNNWFEFSQDIYFVARTQTQARFRHYNDDGTDSTATAKAALNTNISLAPGVNNRTRFSVETANQPPTQNSPFRLFYSLNGGAWTQVQPPGTGTTAIEGANSVHINPDDPTTDKLGGTGTFNPGTLDDNNAITNVFTSTPAVGHRTEVEYCYQILDALTNPGDTIALRVYDGTTAIDTYTSVPTITVSSSVITETGAFDNTGAATVTIGCIRLRKGALASDSVTTVSEIPKCNRKGAISSMDSISGASSIPRRTRTASIPAIPAISGASNTVRRVKKSAYASDSVTGGTTSVRRARLGSLSTAGLSASDIDALRTAPVSFSAAGIGADTLAALRRRLGAHASSGSSTSAISGKSTLRGVFAPTGISTSGAASKAIRRTGVLSDALSEALFDVTRAKGAILHISGSSNVTQTVLRRRGSSLSAAGVSSSDLVPHLRAAGILVAAGQSGGTLSARRQRNIHVVVPGLTSTQASGVRVRSVALLSSGLAGASYVPLRRRKGGYVIAGSAALVSNASARYETGLVITSLSEASFGTDDGPNRILAAFLSAGLATVVIAPLRLRSNAFQSASLANVAYIPRRNRFGALTSGAVADIAADPLRIRGVSSLISANSGLATASKAIRSTEFDVVSSSDLLWTPTRARNAAISIDGVASAEFRIIGIVDLPPSVEGPTSVVLVTDGTSIVALPHEGSSAQVSDLGSEAILVG